MHLVVDMRDEVVLGPSLLLSEESYHLRNIYIQVAIDTVLDWQILDTTDKEAVEGKDYAQEARVNSSSVQVDRDSGPADADAWTTLLVAGGSYPVGDVADASPEVAATCCCYYSWQNTAPAADAPVAMIEAACCVVWCTVACNFAIVVAHVVVVAAAAVGVDAKAFVADKSFVACWQIVAL